MRGLDELGAAGALAPQAIPLLGDPVIVMGRVARRPGMCLEPEIGRCEPSLSAGLWVEISLKGLSTQVIWVPFSDCGQRVCVLLEELAHPLTLLPLIPLEPV